MTAAIATLNPAALVALASCEQRIERGLKTFIDVGQALAEIRDSRLYKGTHETFEDYCRVRWNLSRPRAYELISAAEVVSAMADTEHAPTNERQARALAKVPEPERADVWRETVERTEGKPTAAAIREVHEERTRPPFPGPADTTTPPVDPGKAPAPVVDESPALAAPQELGPTGEHDASGAWKGDEPGSCGVECLCGVVFDGFDSLKAAGEELARHIESADLTAEILAALPRSEADAVCLADLCIWLGVSCEDSGFAPVMAVLNELVDAGEAGRAQGPSVLVYWAIGAGSEYKTDPAERIAAVAEVAPEYVKAAEPDPTAADAAWRKEFYDRHAPASKFLAWLGRGGGVDEFVSHADDHDVETLRLFASAASDLYHRVTVELGNKANAAPLRRSA